MFIVIPEKPLKRRTCGFVGTVAAKTAAASENGPQPIKFFTLYLKRNSLPLITPYVTV